MKTARKTIENAFAGCALINLFLVVLATCCMLIARVWCSSMLASGTCLAALVSALAIIVVSIWYVYSCIREMRH